MSRKMEEVREAGIRVVSEDFLCDVSSSAKSLPDLLSAHLLAPWGAEVKAEPEEPAAPRAKSGSALSKKSKGPVKEEGEAPGCPGSRARMLPRHSGQDCLDPLAYHPLTLPPHPDFLVFVLLVFLSCSFPRHQQI